MCSVFSRMIPWRFIDYTMVYDTLRCFIWICVSRYIHHRIIIHNSCHKRVCKQREIMVLLSGRVVQ